MKTTDKRANNGGKRPNSGRPKTGGKVYSVWLTPAQYKAIIERYGSMREWVLQSAVVNPSQDA